MLRLKRQLAAIAIGLIATAAADLALDFLYDWLAGALDG